mgnify:CR=1 FL=1|jgi:hypothetical protein
MLAGVEKLISPYDLLPEKESVNLELIFNVLLKNGWRLGKFDKKFFFKFKKYGFKTYLDKEKLAHLLYKYRKQIEGIVRKMDKTDLGILTKSGFFELMDKLQKGEQVTESEVKIPYDKLDTKTPFDKDLQYQYNNATFFPRNLNEWYWSYYQYALGDILLKIDTREIKPSPALVDAMERVKRALYEYIYTWAIETIKYPSPIVVGFSKYPFHQAQKSADRKLRAMERFAKALKYLDKVLENEKIKAKGIKDLGLRFSKVKEIKQVKVDRVEIKGFMYPSGNEHVRVFFHFTWNDKPFTIEEIYKGRGYAISNLNGLLKLRHYVFNIGEELVQLEWDAPEVKRWEMFFFNAWYNLGFYHEITKRGVTRKRLYFSKVTGLSGWMDEDEKPSKDNWIACRVDPYFNWAREIIGKLNKDLRDLEKLVKKKWSENKIYYLDHLSEIKREVEFAENEEKKKEGAKKVEVPKSKGKGKKKAKKTKKSIKESKKVMNKSLQIYNLKKFLKKHGIEPDLVDLEALVDSKLTYHENKENIKKQLGISDKSTVKPSDLEIQEIEEAIKQAQMYHEMRSERAQMMDEKKFAKLPKDPEAWFRHPEKYDLPEVDYPLPISVEEYVEEINKKKKRKKKSKKKK